MLTDEMKFNKRNRTMPEFPDTRAFTAELTDICNKHGLGIEGGTIYAQIPEDQIFRYACDDDSKLVRL